MANFIDIHHISPETLQEILALAISLKARMKRHESWQPLAGKHLAMIFEKPSTRTRTSFEVGINQLGGHAIVMDAQSSQLGRGELPSDTAKVLSRYVDLIMMRCFSHDLLTTFATHASVPVINGLTDSSHPCQVMADIMTFFEYHGPIQGKKVAWLGDGNNVLHSWIHAAVQLDFELHIATPETLKPSDSLMQWAKNAKRGHIHWTLSASEAVQQADIVTTDTWVSMGSTSTTDRHEILAPYQVNQTLMKQANTKAIFMHCLPAHRDEEVTSDVIDGPQSVIFDEAENRLHIQKAIMIWCLKNTSQFV